MIACFLDVLKCPFSLVSETEFTKVFFNSFQNVSCHFTCFSEDRINRFRLNLPLKVCFVFREFCNIDMT